MPRSGRRAGKPSLSRLIGRRGGRSRPKDAPSTFESLEARLPMAADIGTALWRIAGDRVRGSFDDTIVVDRDPADALRLRASINGTVVGTRLEAAVRVIHVFGGRGDDTISIDIPGNTRIRTWLVGGVGNDTIQGGEAADHIQGGAGNDTINAGGGNDAVEGGDGHDSLVGGAGHDTLRGDGGRDTLRGGAGKNTLLGGTGIDQFYGLHGVDRVRLAAGETLIGNESTNPLRTVTSADQLKAWYFDTAMQQWGGQLGRTSHWWHDMLVTRQHDGALSAAGPGSATANPDFSGTNNQVAGVEEGDLVKTDGRSLFVLAGDGVDIVSAWPAESLAVTSHVSVDGDERSLFLNGSRLTVISQENRWTAADGSVQPMVGRLGWWGGGQWAPQVVVTVIDVSNTAEPRVLEKTTLDGWFLDAREIDGRVFVVAQADLHIPAPALLPVEDGSGGTSSPSTPDPSVAVGSADSRMMILPPIDFPPGDPRKYVYEDEAAYRIRLEKAWSERALPSYTVTASSGATADGSLVAVDRTYVPLEYQASNLLSVVEFDISDDAVGPESSTSVAGISGTVYASSTGLYVSAANWGSWWDSRDTGLTTNIYHFDLGAAGVPLVAMGAVPGTTLDQFSLDEHDGFLRVATTNWGSGGDWNFTNSSAGVFVLGESDGNLVTVGAVQGLAPGERIYSSRFVGDVAYVSTFKQIDPLFVIDLVDPTRPRVVGELKVPGFSSYLQPLDAKHLLGIGRDVDPDTGRVLGLQLSVFDVGDPSKPRRASTYTFAGDGWQSWSSALWDHHALAWFPEQGILTLPVQQGDWWSGSTGLVVLGIDLAADGAFSLLGEISHASAVERGVRIGEYLYSISAGEVKVHRVDDPAVELAGVKLTARDDSGSPVVVF